MQCFFLIFFSNSPTTSHISTLESVTNSHLSSPETFKLFPPLVHETEGRRLSGEFVSESRLLPNSLCSKGPLLPDRVCCEGRPLPDRLWSESCLPPDSLCSKGRLLPCGSNSLAALHPSTSNPSIKSQKTKIKNCQVFNAYF
jgi:hypothetical protein